MNQTELEALHEKAEHFMQSVIELMNTHQISPVVAASSLSNILAILCIKELGLTKEEFDLNFDGFWQRAVAHYSDNGSGVTQ